MALSTRAGLFFIFFVLLCSAGLVVSAPILAPRDPSIEAAVSLLTRRADTILAPREPALRSASAGSLLARRELLLSAPVNQGDAVLKRRGIGDFFRNLGNSIKKGFQKVGEGIKHVAQKIGNGIKHAAQKVGGAIKHVAQKVGGAIKHAAQKVGQGIKHVAQKIGNGVKHAVHKVGQAFKKAGQAIKHVAQKVGNGIKHVAQKVGGAIKHAAQKVGGAIKHAAQKVGHFIKEKGAQIAKFGLKVYSTAVNVAGRVASFIPGVGKPIGRALNAWSKVTNFAADKIPAKLDSKLDKGFQVLDRIQHPFKGAAGQVFDALT